MGFVVDKEALKQVFFEYFGFPCQFSSHELLRTLQLPCPRHYVVTILTVLLNKKKSYKFIISSTAQLFFNI
jgi:hypothetical protein